MAVYRYPPEVHEFVKKYATMLRDQELAEACNKELGTSFTTRGMKSFRGNHGYKNYQKQYTNEEYWKYQTKWPQGMYEFIRDNSWGVSSKDMAEIVNEKFGTNFNKASMKNFRARHKIRSGLTGWYQKGHAPGNKGKKLEEYVTDPDRLADIRRRIAPSWFRRGERPPNELPIGSVTVRAKGKDRNGSYKYVKVSMEGEFWDRWKLLHRKVWEDHNGPIPDDKVVMFKNGDVMNCDINNLMLISRSELVAMTRKGYIFEDPDLTETALNMVRLQQAAQKRRKNSE